MTLILTLLVLWVLSMAIFVGGIYVLHRGLRGNSFFLENIENHQINPRTRIAQAKFDNGPPTPAKSAEKLGRVSRGQRLVVGGDPDSALHRKLSGLPEVAEEESDE